ncbi:DNA-binding NarL/FixJ family response regulator [Bradyrhizobium sp. USDA 4454]
MAGAAGRNPSSGATVSVRESQMPAPNIYRAATNDSTAESETNNPSRREPTGDRLCCGRRARLAPIAQTRYAGSGDTLLRMVHSAPLPDFAAPTVVGIDDWAWRRGQRYGTIICDLERNCVLDLLPDRNAGSVARWLKRWPGIKIVARDRAGLYADGARCGAPNAVQVADRWHLLNSLGDALRHAIGRHRHNLAAAVQIMAAGKTPITGVSASAPGLAQLRADRRAARRERWDEICRLRAQGCATSGIGKLLGVDRRTVQRWLAAGGEPEHAHPLVCHGKAPVGATGARALEPTFRGPLNWKVSNARIDEYLRGVRPLTVSATTCRSNIRFRLATHLPLLWDRRGQWFAQFPEY